MNYWMIIAEIDATYFCIEQVMGQVSRRTPFEQLIDKATGYDKEQEAAIRYWVARIKRLQAKLPPDDPHFVRT